MAGPGTRTRTDKLTKAEAGYVAVSQVPGEVCCNCLAARVHPAVGRLSCTKVEGDVEAGGWCELWTGAPPRR